MTLTGNLEVFPLEEVLRMLARSRKSGCLRIDSAGLQGRVFIHSGGLTFASTASDDEFRRQLLSSGMVEESKFRRVELSGASLAEVLSENVSSAMLSDFVREHVVESLFRIRRSGRGTFDFAIDLGPRYPTAQSFDVDVMLTEADRRAAEWSEIEAVIPDGNVPMRMIPELGDDEPVTLNASTWKILAALGSGASVADMARRMGMSEFRASRELAGLVRNSLVSPLDGAVGEPVAPAGQEAAADPSETPTATEVVEPDPEPEPVAQPEPEPEPEPTVAQEDHAAEDHEPEEAAHDPWAGEAVEPDAAPAPTGADVHAAAPAEPESTDTPWERSTWSVEESSEEPQTPWSGWGAEPTTPSDEVAAEPEPEPEPTGDSSGGWWAQTMGDAESANDGGSDSDADKFLESVFSSLSDQDETPGDGADDETGFGLGLLRRRRMGAAARDIPENDR